MGFVFSRLRKKKTRIDQLDEVYQELEDIKLARGQCQSYEKSFVAYLIIVSFLVYLVGAAILYLYFRPSTWLETAARLTPFVVFPVIVITIKWLLSSYFNHRRNKYDMKLRELSQKKKKLLDEVKELEPYNVVRQILEKYDPGSLPQMAPPPPPHRGGEPGGLRQRHAPPPGQQPGTPQRGPPVPPPGGAGRPPPPPPGGAGRPPPPPPGGAGRPPPPSPGGAGRPPPPSPGGAGRPPPPGTPGPLQHLPSGPHPPPPPPGPPAPRYVPPRERGVMEKLVDYMIGDGPGKRYALICSTCYSHNGMALQDEFEYTSFRCAYCFTLNPSRKKLPTAPRLELQTSQGSNPSTPGSSVKAAAAEVKEGGSGREQQQGTASTDREGEEEATRQENSHPGQQGSETAAATSMEAQNSS